MKTPVDLGYKMDMGPSSTSSMPDKMYPNLHLEWPSDYDLPESGTMTVKFVKTGENKSKGPNGKQRFTVDLEIKSIESVKKGKVEAEEKEETGAEALDRHAAEMEEESY